MFFHTWYSFIYIYIIGFFHVKNIQTEQWVTSGYSTRYRTLHKCHFDFVHLHINNFKYLNNILSFNKKHAFKKGKNTLNIICKIYFTANVFSHYIFIISLKYIFKLNIFIFIISLKHRIVGDNDVVIKKPEDMRYSFIWKKKGIQNFFFIFKKHNRSISHYTFH